MRSCLLRYPITAIRGSTAPWHGSFSALHHLDRQLLLVRSQPQGEGSNVYDLIRGLISEGDDGRAVHSCPASKRRRFTGDRLRPWSIGRRWIRRGSRASGALVRSGSPSWFPNSKPWASPPPLRRSGRRFWASRRQQLALPMGSRTMAAGITEHSSPPSLLARPRPPQRYGLAT